MEIIYTTIIAQFLKVKLMFTAVTLTVPVSGTMIGNTDTRHYLKLTKNIYRFSPTFMYPDDLKRFHGVNERISPNNYEEAVNFFYHLIINSDKVELPKKHSHDEH